MKNEATIMMHVIGNETDEEILEVSKQIISLNKHMDINLKIVRVEPVADSISLSEKAEARAYLDKYITLTGTVANKHDDSLDAHLYSQHIADQIRG